MPSFIFCDMDDIGYEIKPIFGKAGIFFEDLGEVKIYQSYMKVIAYQNISFYNIKYDFIERMVIKAQTLCHVTNKVKTNNLNYKINMPYCDQVTNFLNIQLPIMKNKHTSLIQLIGHYTEEENTTRRKRGFINAGGTLLNWLFGVADSDDVDYYNDAINRVANDDKEIQYLMKEQIQVIKSTIKNFNASVQNLNKNEKILLDNLNKINDFMIKTKDFEGNTEAQLKLGSYFNLLTYLVNELNSELDQLIDSVLFSTSNIIHPSILTPKQLVSELESQQHLLKEGLQYPIPITSSNIHNIISICKVKAYYKDGNLIFIITIPLVNEMAFQIYKCLPLPQSYTNDIKTHAYIQPNHTYIAMSHNRISYFQLNALDKCVQIQDHLKICDQQTLHATEEKPTCETILLIEQPKQIPKICQISYLHGEVNIWQPLQSNEWLFVKTTPSRISILCKDRKPKDEQIIHTGIIKLSSNCKGFTGTTSLIPRRKNIQSTIYHSIPEVSITEDDCCIYEKLNDTNRILPLLPIHISNLNLEDLKLANHKLNQFNEEINNILNKPNIILHRKWYFYVLIVVVGIICIFLVYRLMLFTGLWRIVKWCFPSRSHTTSKDGCIQIFNQCFKKDISTPNQVRISLREIAEAVTEEEREELSSASAPLRHNFRSRIRPMYPDD
jgi:hypothetical protein